MQGVAEQNVFAFKGIPFAAPPVGESALARATPCRVMARRAQGDVYGNACIQVPGLSEANGGNPGSLSEDCLYLNVWTPKPTLRPSFP